jgi:deoxyadenosine/deoxycytidine kinase
LTCYGSYRDMKTYINAQTQCERGMEVTIQETDGSITFSKNEFGTPYHGIVMTPLRKKYMRLRGYKITIEGTIATGKSTLVRSLTRYLNRLDIQTIGYKELFDPDHRDLFIEGLSASSERRNANAFSFQLDQLMYRKLVDDHASKMSAKGHVAIMDRSYIGDFTFARMQHKVGNISDREMSIYMGKQRRDLPTFGNAGCTSRGRIYTPSVTIYLDCSPKVAKERTLRRGNEREKDYSLEYYEELDREYRESLKLFEHPILIESWNDDKQIVMDGEVEYLTDEICEDILDKVLGVE